MNLLRVSSQNVPNHGTSSSKAPRLDAMLGAIVAFRMTIKRIDAKFKLSQNRGAADRERVITALQNEGHGEASATADVDGATMRARPDSGDVPYRVRFDKWLWAARFYKTRSLASQAIEAGQARIAGERVKAAHPVRARRTHRAASRRSVWDIRVVALPSTAVAPRMLRSYTRKRRKVPQRASWKSRAERPLPPASRSWMGGRPNATGANYRSSWTKPDRQPEIRSRLRRAVNRYSRD